MSLSASPSQTLITIKPITSEADIPICAHLADVAVKPDGLHEFKARYSPKSLYDETFEHLMESLRGDRRKKFLFKAVVPSPSMPNSSQAAGQVVEEVIVGFAQWHLGYVEVPKMDPFAPRNPTEEKPSLEAGLTNVVVAEARYWSDNLPDGARIFDGLTSSQKPKPFYSNPHQELSRKTGNAYIGAIRGKRHVHLHRLIVDPSYQRQGIGQKLVDWGIETAERENIVAWLFCRPAGYKLYERNGWKVVLTIEVDVPDTDLDVAPILAMLRL